MSIFEEIINIIQMGVVPGIIGTVVGAAAAYWFKIKSDREAQDTHEANLRKVLIAYIEAAHEDLKKYNEEYTRKKVKELIGKVNAAEEKGEKYMPHMIYDKTKGITISDVMKYYGFLKQEEIENLTRCIIELNYLEAIYEELNTEYVRGFDTERKIAIVKGLGEAQKDAYTAVSALKKKLND